jgi:hypothetical protein
MLIKTPNKELAFRAIINTWLKDKTIYCNSCGQTFETYPKDACCLEAQIGTNAQVLMAIVQQNKDAANTRGNEFGSNDDKNLRWGLSLPPGLHNMLDNFKKMHNQPGIFQEDGEMTWFMKKFPVFKTCQRT